MHSLSCHFCHSLFQKGKGKRREQVYDGKGELGKEKTRQGNVIKKREKDSRRKRGKELEKKK